MISDHRRRLTLIVAALALTAWPAAAQTSRPASQPAAEVNPTIPVKPKAPPQHITVQHILIAFDGSLPGQSVGRTKEEAARLAAELLARARAGAPFDTLVKQWTNDAFPGIYSMANFKVPAATGEYARERMVGAFGNVGFEISPGNIGLAEFDPKTSPYGWHIIKRLK